MCSQVTPTTYGEIITFSEATKTLSVDSGTKSVVDKISSKAMIIT
jgi:hypothetical protein